MLNLNSLAASPCVISFFLVFFNATSRSLSTWVISSCPSCIPKAWGCQDDISTLLKDDILILLPHSAMPLCATLPVTLPLCHFCHFCLSLLLLPLLLAPTTHSGCPELQ